MDKYQFLLSGGVIPSILVVLSWIHNNTRLSRLEAGQDALNRRMDEQVRGFHADMISFQASMLESNFQLRERIAVVETKIER